MTVHKNLLHRYLSMRVVLCMMLLAFMLVVTGFASTNKNIRIVVDGKTMTVDTAYVDPREVLQSVGIKLNAGDKYEVSTKNLINGSTITVERSIPVRLKIGDKIQEVQTTANNINDMLVSLGYNPYRFDTTNYENQLLRPNVLVKLEPLTFKIAFREKIVPYNKIYRKDYELAKGETRIIQKGKNGVNKETLQVYYKAGQKVNEEVLQQSVIQPVIPEIVAEGAKEPNIGYADTGLIPPYKRVVNVTASAYLPSDGGGGGYTATGVLAKRGVIAVDPDVIPLGSRVYVPGYGIAVAADTGGFSGHVIDVCVDNYAEAMQWGRRNINVYIL